MSPTLDAETYAHLRAVARRIVGGRSQTLQATALLHEAWAKLDRSRTTFESRSHFMAVAAQAMRQILINHARNRSAQKRGGGMLQTTLAGVSDTQDPVDLLALDQAIQKLEAADPSAARIVVLRVFGGLTLPEVAEALQTSERTASRTWRFARAFLKRTLEEDPGSTG